MSWTDSEIESLITFYSSMLASGARNFATGVKNRRQKPTPVFWRLAVSGAGFWSVCHQHKRLQKGDRRPTSAYAKIGSRNMAETA